MQLEAYSNKWLSVRLPANCEIDTHAPELILTSPDGMTTVTILLDQEDVLHNALEELISHKLRMFSHAKIARSGNYSGKLAGSECAAIIDGGSPSAKGKYHWALALRIGNHTVDINIKSFGVFLEDEPYWLEMIDSIQIGKA